MARIKGASNHLVYWIAIFFSAIFSFFGRSAPTWAEEITQDHHAQAFHAKYHRTQHKHAKHHVYSQAHTYSEDERGKAVMPGETRGKAVTPADTRGKAVMPGDMRGKAVTPADTRGKAVMPGDTRGKAVTPADLQGKPSSQLEMPQELKVAETALNQQFDAAVQNIQFKIAQGDELTPGELGLLKNFQTAQAIEDLKEQINILNLAILNMKEG